MSLFTEYPEMFPDRVTIKLPTPSSSDNSGGRVDANALVKTGVPCSIQTGTYQDSVNVGSMQYIVETKVYFPASPGRLPSGTRLIVESLDGEPPEGQGNIIAYRVARDGLHDLKVWRADCTGRA